MDTNCQKSNSEFKLGLLKSFYYDGTTNYFSMWAFEPDSRKMVNFKELKYYHDFRKPDENSSYRNETNLDLKNSLVAKLIQLFKKLLEKYSLAGFDRNNLSIANNETDTEESTSNESVSSKCGLITAGHSNVSPLKQRLIRYELMHIDRKIEVFILRMFICILLKIYLN